MKPTVHPDVLLALKDHLGAFKALAIAEVDKAIEEYRKLRDDVESKLDAVGGLSKARDAAQRIMDEAETKSSALIADAESFGERLKDREAGLDSREKALEARLKAFEDDRAKLDDDIASQADSARVVNADLAARSEKIKSEESRLASLSASLNEQLVAVAAKAEKLRSAAAGL